MVFGNYTDLATGFQHRLNRYAPFALESDAAIKGNQFEIFSKRLRG